MFVKEVVSNNFIWINPDHVEAFEKLGPGVFNVDMLSGRTYRVKFFGDLEGFRKHMDFPADSPPPESDREVTTGNDNPTFN